MGSLKLYSALKGTIIFRSQLDTLNDLQSGKICTQFLKTFSCDTMILMIPLCVKEDDLPPLLLVSWYVASKTIEKAEYSSCKAMFGSHLALT